MIDQKFVDMLRCPIDGIPLIVANQALVDRVNRAIERGEIRDRLDQRVTEPINAGLMTEKATRLFPIRAGIPTLVADEAIELGSDWLKGDSQQ